MSRATEIDPIERTIKKYLEKIKKDPHNSKILLRYYQSRVAEGISRARITKCLYHMIEVSSILKKSFNDATKDDLKRVMANIESRDYWDSTIDDYRAILKHFYRWFRDWDDDGFPEEVRWIKRKKTRLLEYKRCVTVGDLLTPEEKQAMAKAAGNPRDRALIQISNECGKRPGNILTPRIGDVSFDSLGAIVKTVGKTGPSQMRLISSAPDLAIWLDCHPFRDNPKAPLWIVLEGKNYGKQLCHGSAIQRLKRIAKRAGIKKNVYFYLQRYTRIYESMTVLTEDLQCQQFDWVFGSKQPAQYKKMFRVHGDDAQCILNGLKPSKLNQELKPELAKPKTCIRCKTQNSSASKFCNRCGYVLDVDTAIQIDQERKEYEDKLNALVKDPEKLKKLVLLLESTDLPDPKR